MGTFNGNAQGGRFSARRAQTGGHGAAAWKQIGFSLLLLLDLFLLYTIAMQLTHKQMAFETTKTVNLTLLALFILGAVGLGWMVIRTHAWKRLLCLALIACICYLTVAYSQLPLFKENRETWIKTAMATMRHQGLATFYFPASTVDEVWQQYIDAAGKQDKIESGDPTNLGNNVHDAEDWTEPTGNWAIEEEKFDKLTDEQKTFYSMFYELDVDSAEAYFKDHPAALQSGYLHVLVNEASLNSNGTSIVTKLGEKVLAIDAENQILILEVRCDGARGVLAVAKRPDWLHLFPAETLPNHGQTVGTIASKHNGILAMTGSGFIDEGGVGNGGQIAGWAMCSGGKTYGSHYGWSYKRLEMRENNWFYIKKASDKVDPDTRDAMEFQPAMIVDGEGVDIGYWTDKNPRACMGQSKRGEILMLCVEGRGAGGSWGCSLNYCKETLLQHDCQTAMNCDGGTTAIMWYRGEPIMRCSNSSIPQGRYLPNAWVYVGE